MTSLMNYMSFPKMTISYPTIPSYTIISYYGNTVSTSTPVYTGNLTTGTYISPDLSFNTLYNFKVTPYNSAGISGKERIITIDTTPYVAGVYASSSTNSNAQIQWYGTYSYVKIYRSISAPFLTAYVDVSSGTNFSTIPYYDRDLSGNTTYNYFVRPFDANGNAYTDSSAITVTTNAQAARDLSAVFFDTSAIQIQFTAPKNSYSSTYYYQLNAVYSGVTTSISGSSSPLLVKGLAIGTTYSCYIISYLDNVLRATSDMLSVKISGAIVTYSGATTVTYNTYTNYVFTSGATNTISFSEGLTFSLLAVGGGGGAGGDAGGGGGGGGVFQYSITTTQSDTLTISIGSGGAVNTNGGNTTVVFTNSIFNLSKTITAAGGGAGGRNNSLGNNGVSVSTGYGSGGSGGGTGRDPNTAGRKSGGSGSGVGVGGYGGGGSNTTGIGWVGGSGGGGAGEKGVDGSGNNISTNQKAGSGGTGVACTLPGIDNTYFWGGGGAGGIEASVGTPGAGGKGGGGGGSYYGAGGSKGSSNNTYPTVTNGSDGTSGSGGKGGTNSGGGGAGGNNGSSGSPGGSGIVIIAVLN